MKAFFSRFLLCVTCIAIMAMASACGRSPQPMEVVIFSAQRTATPEITPSVTAEQASGSAQPTETLEIKPSATVEQASGSAQPTGTPAPVRESCLAGSVQPTPTLGSNLSLDAEQDWGYKCAVIEMAQTPAQTPTQGQYPALHLTYQPENNPQEEIAATVRKLVEDKEQPIYALLGATSNESSMRLASLSNFFTVPMIIPSSVGDNLLPSNNLWGFRLSAPGASHAQYFFGSVLTRSLLNSFSSNNESELIATPAPFKVAILYEQNTFGESAAVAAAKEAMKQDVKIGFYGSFDPATPDSTRLKAQADEIMKQGVHLVYLISSQSQAAQAVIKSIRDNIPQDEMPVLLGQSGAFSSLEFLDSPKSQGMFVLRQKIIADHCPSEITSLAAAQSYAAIALLRSAMQQAKNSGGNTYASKTLAQKREAVRDALKTTNQDFTCLGRVSFDNTGQNKNLQFEILQITPNGSVVIDEKAFGEILKPIYRRSPFDIGQ